MELINGLQVPESRQLQDTYYDPLDALLQGQAEILEIISRGLSLHVRLDKITKWVERHSKEKIQQTLPRCCSCLLF